MKTKTRTLIGIFALGIIGFANINATIDNKREVNANVATELEESLTIESWMLDNDYWTTTNEADTVDSEKATEIEAWMLNENLWK